MTLERGKNDHDDCNLAKESSQQRCLYIQRQTDISLERTNLFFFEDFLAKVLKFKTALRLMEDKIEDLDEIHQKDSYDYFSSPISASADSAVIRMETTTSFLGYFSVLSISSIDISGCFHEEFCGMALYVFRGLTELDRDQKGK
jgi:hypothetical protein